MRGPTGTIITADKPAEPWASELLWESVTYIDAAIPKLKGLRQHILDNLEPWCRWMTSADPQDEPLPGGAFPLTAFGNGSNCAHAYMTR